MDACESGLLSVGAKRKRSLFAVIRAKGGWRLTATTLLWGLAADVSASATANSS
jgi:hypothetical protein